jgi:DnaJ-class molecular chaperone
MEKMTCPSCRGSKGGHRQANSYESRWVDCVECNGAGEVVRTETSEKIISKVVTMHLCDACNGRGHFKGVYGMTKCARCIGSGRIELETVTVERPYVDVKADMEKL